MNKIVLWILISSSSAHIFLYVFILFSKEEMPSIGTLIMVTIPSLIGLFNMWSYFMGKRLNLGLWNAEINQPANRLGILIFSLMLLVMSLGMIYKV